MNATPEYHLFPNGTSFDCWHSANCSKCWKQPPPGHVGTNRKCAIENAIALGTIDGTLLAGGATTPEKAARIAARLGWDGNEYLTTDCPECEEKRPAPKTKRGHRIPKNQAALPL